MLCLTAYHSEQRWMLEYILVSALLHAILHVVLSQNQCYHHHHDARCSLYEPLKGTCKKEASVFFYL